MLIGNYKIGDHLGSGGYGVVYKAFDSEKGEFVAIKSIEHQLLSPQQITEVCSEIEVLQKLQHRNIVKYLGSQTDERHLHIFLDYVEAGSLAFILKKYGFLQKQVTALYASQILCGLQYLHDQGVVHRDIKGPNILVTKRGLVKLADFGVAMKLSERNSQTCLVGTPFWMAPEIVEMQTPTPACDIWSVGATVCEMLTGRPPYYDLNPMAALFRIVSDTKPPIPDQYIFDDEVSQFLHLCFQKDPFQRPEAGVLLRCRWFKSEKTRERRRFFFFVRHDFRDKNCEIRKLLQKLRPFGPPGELVQTCYDLTKLFSEKRQPSELMNYGAVPILEMLHVNDLTMLMAVLRLVNRILEIDEQFGAHLLLVGIVPKIVKFTEPHYLNVIRYQTSIFFQHLARDGNLEMLIACGGLKGMSNLLAYDFENNREIVLMSLSTISTIFEKVQSITKTDLCRLLSDLHVASSLCELIEFFSRDESTNSAISLLEQFAETRDGVVNVALATPEVLKSLSQFLYLLESSQVLRVLQILQLLCEDSSILNLLENAGLVAKLVKFLRYTFLLVCEEEEGTSWTSDVYEAQKICINSLLLLLKVSKNRQEQAVVEGVIDPLLGVDSSTASLQILCDFVRSSELTRHVFHQLGGVLYLIKAMEQPASRALVLETLVCWLQLRDWQIVVEKRIKSRSAWMLWNIVSIFDYGDDESFVAASRATISPLTKLIRLSKSVKNEILESPAFFLEYTRVFSHFLYPPGPKVEPSYFGQSAGVRANLLRLLFDLFNEIDLQRLRQFDEDYFFSSMLQNLLLVDKKSVVVCEIAQKILGLFRLRRRRSIAECCTKEVFLI